MTTPGSSECNEIVNMYLSLNNLAKLSEYKKYKYWFFSLDCRVFFLYIFNKKIINVELENHGLQLYKS
jgi:hypothetical protein